MTPEEQADYRARRGSVEDIVNLVSLYSQLEASAKGDLLTHAAELLAEQRVRGRKTPDGDDYEAYDWLKNLAEETYPRGDDAARLLARAFDVNCDGGEIVFGDDQLSVVLTPSEEVWVGAECLYEGYLLVYDQASPALNLPSVSEFFGFKEPKRDYAECEYSETEEEANQRIRNREVTKFSGMISIWRRDFFQALLER